MPNTSTIDAIRVLVFREDDVWVAQCVDYDIGAQANDLATLRRRFNATISADIEESVRRNGAPFSGIDPAPRCYERMWAERSERFTSLGVTSARPNNSHHVGYEMAMCA